ncbi:MAG TPA: hypothetical protein VHX38_26710 [Pseudonocardiaceae bacterium]|nr:hypothetical protein [Pseudonocardiaceae bacterium]
MRNFLGRRVIAATAIAGVMASGLVLATAGSAAAAPAAANEIELCSYGNYASYVQFPNFDTEVVNAGACETFGVGASDDVESFNIYGLDDSGSSFFVGQGYIRPSRGGEVVTYGTEGNSWAETPTV